MKLIHLSDLHIGKRVNGFSMLEDQQYILDQILGIIREEAPDAVLIAGDVYDKPIPSAEAVALYDSFMTRLAALGTTVCMISGNHDSAERVACCGKLMEKNRVYVAPVYDGRIEPVTISGEDLEAKVWLLPFVKPANVRAHLEEEKISDYTDALRCMIGQLELDPDMVNIAVAHQFISGAEICESEEHDYSRDSVGGVDQVSVAVFDAFDYVALGHLHGPQKVGRETVRYAGSPLKYSFSEMHQKKSVTIVEVKSKASVKVRQVALKPVREFVEIRGTFAELTAPETLQAYDPGDYFHIILTDEQDVPNAASRLRGFYPNWMVLDYDNSRTRTQLDIAGAVNVQKRSTMDIFTELFQKQMGREMNPFQQEFLSSLIEEIQEGDR